MRRLVVVSVLAVLAVLGAALPVGAQPFPDRIELPDGWQPEGIAVGARYLYSGSLAGGGIYRADLRSGAGEVLVEEGAGAAAGLALSSDGSLLFAAGGPTGTATVYDADTGDVVASYDLAASDETFVNDVIVTADAAWFTDSFQQVLYRVDLDRRGQPTDATTVPLTGDIAYVDGFNANGIEAIASGDTLIVVQGNTGQLFAVDASTGVADEIDLGDDDVTNGDGLLLRGRTLYVVENFDQAITRVDLGGDLSAGTVVSRTGDPGFDVPTTIGRRGSLLYAVNARFSTPPTADTAYWVTVLRLP